MIALVGERRLTRTLEAFLRHQGHQPWPSPHPLPVQVDARTPDWLYPLCRALESYMDDLTKALTDVQAGLAAVKQTVTDLTGAVTTSAAKITALTAQLAAAGNDPATIAAFEAVAADLTTIAAAGESALTAPAIPAP